MTTIGKSDVFEAVAQIVVLRILYERDKVEAGTLVRELRRRTKGLHAIQNAAGYLALSKLESSGWIHRPPPSSASTVTYQLSKTAKRFLSTEFDVWKSFVDQWPLIQRILQKAVEPLPPRPYIPAIPDNPTHAQG